MYEASRATSDKSATTNRYVNGSFGFTSKSRLDNIAKPWDNLETVFPKAAGAPTYIDSSSQWQRFRDQFIDPPSVEP
jgi:hypothetical protein